MTSAQTFNLALLYEQAIELTDQSRSALSSGRVDEARASLSARSKLLRAIQKEMAAAPLWGKDAAADDAALRYLHADQRLSKAIEACC